MVELDEHFIPARVVAAELVPFPKGPTPAMLQVLPAAARIVGAHPWRPHVFARHLLAEPRSSSAFVAGSALLHLVIDRGAAPRAWSGLFAALGESELPARPSMQQVAPLWRPGLKQLGFDIEREWQRLVGGHLADAVTPTPRVRRRRRAAGGGA